MRSYVLLVVAAALLASACNSLERTTASARPAFASTGNVPDLVDLVVFGRLVGLGSVVDRQAEDRLERLAPQRRLLDTGTRAKAPAMNRLAGRTFAK